MRKYSTHFWSCYVTVLYLRAEDSSTITGHILLVALIEVTLCLMDVTPLTRTFAEGHMGTATSMGQIAFGITEV